MISLKVKQYLLSSLVTFIATVLIYIYPHIDTITAASFKDGTLLGLLFVAIRGGIKVVIEGAIAWYEASQFANYFTSQSIVPATTATPTAPVEKPLVDTSAAG